VSKVEFYCPEANNEFWVLFCRSIAITLIIGQ